MKFAVLATFALAMQACPPSPAPVPPDASDASSPPPPDPPDASPTIDAAPPAPDASTDGGSSLCALACANLVALGCAEGKAPNCVATCQHTQASPITDLHTACVATKRTKADVRACGSVACP